VIGRFFLGGLLYTMFGLIGLAMLPAFALVAVVHRADPGARHRGRMMRRFGRLTSRCNPLWRFSVDGRPPDDILRRGYVVIANHESQADPFLLARVPWDMRWVSKESLFKPPLIGWLMRLGGDIPLRRGSRDSVEAMMRACRETLAAGVPVMLFPEGTRSPDGRLLPFKDGAFRLAIEAGVPVLPLAVAGTRECRPKHSAGFRFARARVRILDPIPTEGLTLDDIASLREAARDRIDAALPGLRRDLGLVVAERPEAAAPTPAVEPLSD